MEGCLEPAGSAAGSELLMLKCVGLSTAALASLQGIAFLPHLAMQSVDTAALPAFSKTRHCCPIQDLDRSSAQPAMFRAHCLEHHALHLAVSCTVLLFVHGFSFQAGHQCLGDSRAPWILRPSARDFKTSRP